MDFTIMWMDEEITKVHISDDKKEVNVVNLSENHRPFVNGRIDLPRIYEFMKDRCLDDGKVGLDEILASYGMTYNDPWEWCQKTHGVMFEDKYWIKYDGEDICYNDVRVR